MQPPPDGLWGMPPAMLQTLPGYGPDVAKNRAEARKLMEKAGYGQYLEPFIKAGIYKAKAANSDQAAKH